MVGAGATQPASLAMPQVLPPHFANTPMPSGSALAAAAAGLPPHLAPAALAQGAGDNNMQLFQLLLLQQQQLQQQQQQQQQQQPPLQGQLQQQQPPDISNASPFEFDSAIVEASVPVQTPPLPHDPGTSPTIDNANSSKLRQKVSVQVSVVKMTRKVTRARNFLPRVCLFARVREIEIEREGVGEVCSCGTRAATLAMKAPIDPCHAQPLAKCKC
jgi:hypothetical protein